MKSIIRISFALLLAAALITSFAPPTFRVSAAACSSSCSAPMSVDLKTGNSKYDYFDPSIVYWVNYWRVHQSQGGYYFTQYTFQDPITSYECTLNGQYGYQNPDWPHNCVPNGSSLNIYWLVKGQIMTESTFAPRWKHWNPGCNYYDEGLLQVNAACWVSALKFVGVLPTQLLSGHEYRNPNLKAGVEINFNLMAEYGWWGGLQYYNTGSPTGNPAYAENVFADAYFLVQMHAQCGC